MGGNLCQKTVAIVTDQSSSHIAQLPIGTGAKVNLTSLENSETQIGPQRNPFDPNFQRNAIRHNYITFGVREML